METDRYAYYIQTLQNRDQALLVLAGLVLTALLWYHLLERWPGLRRWLSWCTVAAYLVTMLVFTLVQVPK
jgi:hypothetical protein